MGLDGKGHVMQGTDVYRVVWRWHFYAGLFVIPFILFLSLTGSVYLFRPQIESWLDMPYDHMAGAQSAPPSRVAAAVLGQNPGWRVSKYLLPKGPESAAQILISKNGVERRLYVDRSNLKTIKSVAEQDRPMQVLFRLHGELLAGDRGSNVVELAASWAIVMLLTGLFLWWPRGAKGLGGILYPRLGRGGRTAMRDVHAVTGFWVSIFALGFLLSGLPWASNWGHYLQAIRVATGTAPTSASWFAGPGDEMRARQAEDAAAIHAAHMGRMPGMDMSARPGMAENIFPVPLGMDQAVATATAQHLAPPVMLMAPGPGQTRWKAVSQTLNVPQTGFVIIDGQSGRITNRVDFVQLQWLDRLVGYTTAIHQGQLFGWLNTLANLLIAASLMTMSISAILMWWRRRSPGVLGAPTMRQHLRWPWGVMAAVLVLGALLPEFLASLAIMLAVEFAVLRRLQSTRDWLGLAAR